MGMGRGTLTWARLIHTRLTHTCAEGGMGSWTTDKSGDLLANDPVRSPPKETLCIDFQQMVLLSLTSASPYQKHGGRFMIEALWVNKLR